MRSLIADDNSVNRIVLKKMLEKHGPCDEVTNGREVLAALEAAWRQDRPYDLLCLDIMMPELNGQEVLRAIRKREAERGLPPSGGIKVIVTSVLDDARTIQQAFRDHCEAYMIKPVSRAALDGNLRKLGLVAQEAQ
jgi:two-component system chemotaxis response regulator CheY